MQAAAIAAKPLPTSSALTIRPHSFRRTKISVTFGRMGGVDRLRPARGVAPGPVPDETLVERFRGGDAAAFAELYRRHYGRVYRVALRMSGHPADAEDLAQVVFVRAWHALPRFRVEAQLTTWLYRIVINASLDHRRARKHHPDWSSEPPPDVPAEEDPERPLLDEARHAQLLRALASLPARYRAVVVLHDIEGRPYAEIEEILELPTTTLKMRVVRGREKLAKALRRLEAKR
jgi:RNA polymerase sigma-70 factor (ECF subfamily)